MHDGIFTAAGSKLTSFNMQNVQINTNKYAQNQEFLHESSFEV
jgi:hypothetical protein